MSDLGGFSMMELFREEVRTHAATLGQELLTLERDPGNAQVIEALMRAAHSIKGAARIVNIEPAVQLAHAMESVFVAIQDARVSIVSNDIDVFLHGTDVLGELSLVREDELPAWCAKQQAEVERLKQLLLAMEEGRSADPVSAPHVVSPSLAPAAPARIQVVTLPPEPLASEAERSMMTIFREEVRAAAVAFNTGFPRLETNPQDTPFVETLIDAARVLRGAAKIVRVEPVASLGQLLQEFLVRTRESHCRLSPAAIASLNDVLTLLMDLLVVGDSDLPAWLERNATRWEAIKDGLTLVSDEQPTPQPIKDVSIAMIDPTPAEVPQSPILSAPSALAKPADEPEEAVVRVTAQSLNRLMGLAGESLVQARWLDPFSTSLLKLKKEQDRLAEAVDSASVVLSSESRREQALALLQSVRQQAARCREILGSRMEEFHQHAARAEDLNSRLYREVIASRMRPFSDGAHAFPRLVRDMARDLKKQARLEIEGASTAVDRDVLEKLEAPLTHLLRNAVDHGIEMPDERSIAGKPEVGSIRVKVRHRAGMLSISIIDDGGGIDPERLREKVVERRLTTAEVARRMNDAELLEFLFLPGFSTAPALTEYSGRGVGLDVVQTMVRQVGGSVRISSQFREGTTFHLQLPITLSVLRAVIVSVAGEPYAFPQNRIDRLVRVPPSEIHSIEHRQFISVDGQQVGLVLAAQLFDLPSSTATNEDLSVLLLSDLTGQYGLIVDAFQGEQDLVVRPLDPRLGKVATLSAAAILDDGSPVLIADVEDLIRSMDQFIQGNALRRCEEQKQATGPSKRILVVDDSITVREVERQLLRAQGYDVSVAVDGRDGLNLLYAEHFDLVVSDVDMPRMNGLELVQAMRSDQAFQRLPVIIVSYKEREEDRMRGLEVGANAYLTKSSFHDNTFLQTVTDLIGEN
ncbi:hybrid sensor histidine kinase/response regulator [bacterium]|nr:hybrid sensor histidine kinase/response regulator [bacterium]